MIHKAPEGTKLLCEFGKECGAVEGMTAVGDRVQVAFEDGTRWLIDAEGGKTLIALRRSDVVSMQ